MNLDKYPGSSDNAQTYLKSERPLAITVQVAPNRAELPTEPQHARETRQQGGITENGSGGGDVGGPDFAKVPGWTGKLLAPVYLF